MVIFFVILKAKPSVSAAIKGTLREGETVYAEIKYFGGTQGECINKYFLFSLFANIIRRWFKVKPNSDVLEPLLESMPNNIYLDSTDVGYYIILECTPVRSDGVTGDVIQISTSCAVQPGFHLWCSTNKLLYRTTKSLTNLCRR